LSRRDVARIGNILWRDITTVEKAGNWNDALENESDGYGDVVSSPSVSFSSLFSLFNFLPARKKRGGETHWTSYRWDLPPNINQPDGQGKTPQPS
jgi:hypothetical protein